MRRYPPSLSNPSPDEIYERMVMKLQQGLYGKAFFGHKKTKAEARQLNRLWKKAMKLASGGENAKGSTEAEMVDGISGAGEDQGSSEDINSGKQGTEGTA